MKIHPRSAGGTFGIIACFIGFGLAELFNWDYYKVGGVIMIICFIAICPIYIFFSKKYYAKDDTSNDDTEEKNDNTESDIKQNKDNIKKDSEK